MNKIEESESDEVLFDYWWENEEKRVKLILEKNDNRKEIESNIIFLL